MSVLGVLGTGSFGTALAVALAGAGHRVALWGRRAEQVDEMRAQRRNPTYLPQIELPEQVALTTDLADVASLQVVLCAVPSHGFREVLRELLALRPSVGANGALHLVSATKGMEIGTLARMSQVAAEEGERAGRPVRFGVLSGPTFALELASGAPTTAVVASEDEELAENLQELLSTPTLRLYSSNDVVGVELAGTAKNVVAIAAGICTGMSFGHNTLAALLTRGLHEITRLGVACGGDARTFYGLAGMGDLVLTCTGGLSRNRQIGIELAAGKTLEEITGETRQVAEGVRSSLAVAQLAASHGVSMPITEQMMAVVHRGKAPRRAVAELMGRTLKAEANL